MWKDKCRRFWYFDGWQHIHIGVKNVLKRYKTPTSLNNGNKLSSINILAVVFQVQGQITATKGSYESQKKNNESLRKTICKTLISPKASLRILPPGL